MTNVYIKPSSYQTEIVGEQSYQKNIKEAILYQYMVEKDDLEYVDKKLTATLILDDKNPHDPNNAVRIDIDNMTVGYLDKEKASQYRKKLTQQNITDSIVTCGASVFGKREDYGKPMKFGVWLNFDLSNFELGEPPKRKKFLGLF